MRKTLIKLTGLIVILAVIAGCGKDPVNTPSPTIPGPDTTDTTTVIVPKQYNRDSAIKDYNDMYLGSRISAIGWTGSTSTCDPGTVPQTVHDAVIKRINYFRKITGLNYNCVLDHTLDVQLQRTALIMTASGDLSHDPPSSWPCYTADGAEAAKKSCLRLGSAGPDAIDAFINDEEEYNTSVGHRRWILYAKQSAFGHGATDNVDVVHVLVKSENTKIPEFIAYPPANYIPRELVYYRWSFSIPNADFSMAQVKVSYSGNEVPVTVVSRTDAVADNTIVWELNGGIPSVIEGDRKYTVTVSGILGAAKTSYTYDVIVMKL